MVIKIGDFGISKQFDSYKTLTLTKNKAGSDYYISPEIRKEGIYNEKSDIWSLGCIIYELFNLSIYYKDTIKRKIKIIDSSLYNDKWQELIDSLLEPEYNKRFDINQVNKFLIEDLKINYKDSIEKISNKINNMNINNIVNKIIGEIYIKEDDINKYIRIINSFENVKRENIFILGGNDIWEYENENEKEIKENIEIKINGKIIDFTYDYKFNKEGKYIIEYSFKNNLTKTCFMFYECYKLININLSNFNTQNVTNMRHMFSYCSFTNLDLYNFNTQNVTDMSYMFGGCSSLTNLNLSNFNIENVTNMRGMFLACRSLKKENIITNDEKILQQISYNLTKLLF